MIKKGQHTIFIHLFFWAYFIYVQHVGHNGEWQFSFGLFDVNFLTVSALVFYFNYFFVLPLVFKKFNWIKLIISQFFVFVIFGVLRYFFDQIISQYLFNKQNYYEGSSFLLIVIDNFHFGFKAVFASICVFLIIYSFEKQRQKEALEKEKQKAEISALKSQINPHFLFNALNNIYALVQFDTKNALMGIEKLSQMLRFSTYESQKDMITIKQEIDFMLSMIELSKLSYPNTNFITVNFDESMFSFKIQPFLLSPFLENALKHGEVSSNDPIIIDLHKHENQLVFKIKNKISTKNKDQSSGIGLDNIKKRLLYLYPDKHILKILNIDNYFYVELTLKINEEN